jgi:S-adenosylmethionine:tRNA ribosyltransferase-isomerase
MQLTDFDYDLPEAFIAQTPVEPRDSSRLLVLNRSTGDVVHARFSEIGQFLRAGEVLVFNDTRVLPARLRARKARTGGQAEVLMLKRRAPMVWEVLVGGRNVRLGAVLEIEGWPNLQAVVLEELSGARRVVQFSQPVTPLLEKIGTPPLPPYIHTPLADPARYQTVYAQQPGSAAAPTAGLHFTPELIERLKAQGVETAFITLHVGLDTFQPVAEANIEEHAMHGEWCEMGEEAAAVIARAKRDGRRVIAVGTTSVRTLEAAGRRGPLEPFTDTVNLFIYPGYQYRVVDALITNFHLPKSTLLMLVSAFAGRERILAAYETAKREGYRFYSFGDAMLIV